jgi:hypothetical protein
MKKINPNTRRRRCAITLLIVFLVIVLPALGDYDLSWSTIDGGGGMSKGGPYTLTNTIGQPDAAHSTGGTYKLSGGFWITRYWYPPCWDWPAQCNGDAAGDDYIVGLSDFQVFKDAFGCVYPESCYDPCADFDRDGDVDLTDFQIFKNAFDMGVAIPNCQPGDINEIFGPL